MNVAETRPEIPILRGHFAINCYFEERGILVTVIEFCFGDFAEKKLVYSWVELCDTYLPCKKYLVKSWSKPLNPIPAKNLLKTKALNILGKDQKLDSL